MSSSLISLPSSTKGQAGQALPHFDIHFSCLGGCKGAGGGTFEFTSMSLRLLCLLKAVSGGCLKTSPRCLSVAIMDLQCFACIPWRGGSLGSNFVAKTGRFWVAFFFTLSKAIFLGIFLAFSIPLFISSSGYFLSIRTLLSSESLRSLFFSVVQILTIRSPREKGIEAVTPCGWQLSLSRYCFLSLSFLYKSRSIFPFIIVIDVSNNSVYFKSLCRCLPIDNWSCVQPVYAGKRL